MPNHSEILVSNSGLDNINSYYIFDSKVVRFAFKNIPNRIYLLSTPDHDPLLFEEACYIYIYIAI